MTTFFGRILVYGFLTYAVIFMLWAFLYTYGIASVVVYGNTASVLNYIVIGVAVFTSARYVGIILWRDAFLYGAGWALMHFLLDVVYITPAAGFPALFTQSQFISYGIVLVAPLMSAFVSAFRNSDTGMPPHIA